MSKVPDSLQKPIIRLVGMNRSQQEAVKDFADSFLVVLLSLLVPHLCGSTQTSLASDAPDFTLIGSQTRVLTTMLCFCHCI
jgi:hypothetical protein